MKTFDLSDYDWRQHPVSYDEDDRLHTGLGPADVTVDFAAGYLETGTGAQHSNFAAP
jgi:hypothetical protein